MSIARNSALSFAPQVVAIVTGLVTSVLTARALGPAGRGTLSIVLLTLGVLALVADLGLGGAVTYFVSKGRLAGEAALGFCIGAALLPALVASGVMVAAFPLLRDSALTGVSLRLLLVGLAALPSMLFVNLWVRLEMALGRYPATMVYQSLNAVGLLLVTAVVLFVYHGAVYQLVLATAATYAIVAVMMVLDSMRTRGLSMRLDRRTLREMFSYGLRAYPGGIVYYSTLRLDSFVLNAYAGNASVGQYSMATTLAEKLWLVDSSVGQATMPEVVGRGREAAAQLVAAASRTVVLVSGLGAAALFVIAPYVIGFLYGEAFMPAVTPLRILLPGVVAYASSKLLTQYFAGQMGRPEITSSIAAAIAVVAVSLYLVLIPRYGANGAAWGSTLAYVFGFVLNAFLFRRMTGMPLTELCVPGMAEVRRVIRPLRHLLGIKS